MTECSVERCRSHGFCTGERSVECRDDLIALAGATSGAMSGWVVATTNYTVLSLAGGLLALLLIPSLLVVSSRRSS